MALHVETRRERLFGASSVEKLPYNFDVDDGKMTRIKTAGSLAMMGFQPNSQDRLFYSFNLEDHAITQAPDTLYSDSICRDFDIDDIGISSGGLIA
jgi:hypothetical protein